MQRFVWVVMLLFMVCLKQVATTSMCGEKPHLCVHTQFKQEVSSDGSSVPIKDEPLGNPVSIHHYAVYQSTIDYNSKVYGTMATLSVHELPSIKKGQNVLTFVKIGNFQRNHEKYNNVIHVGWAIQPSFYGDSKTHFTIQWTADGYKSTGCIDLKCDGFVPVNNAPIMPGDSLEGQSKISIKIFKKKDDGDWWLYFGHDGQNTTPVGFWPKNIFNYLADHANIITWGGYTGSYFGDPSPPMGNGRWPGQYSAIYQDIQYVNGDGQGYLPCMAS